MMKGKASRVIAVLLVIILIIVAEVPMAGRFSGEDSFASARALLDTQEERLIAMTLGAVGASTALAMVPGDSTSPVANELADMTSVFSIALSAVLLEKFLLTRLSWLSLRIVIPVGLVLLLLFFGMRRGGFFHIGVRVLLFGLLIMLVIPAGTAVSGAMEAGYQDTLDAAVHVHDEVEAAQSEVVLSEDEAKAQLEASSEKDMSWKDVLHLFTSLPHKVSEAVGDLPDSIAVGVNDLTDNAKEWIQLFVVGLAVILISTIAIPIGILLLGLWAVRTLAGIPIPSPTLPASRRTHRLRGPGTADGEGPDA